MTRVPGVKVQVWNSWRETIPGNLVRRKFLSKVISTLPGTRQ